MSVVVLLKLLFESVYAALEVGPLLDEGLLLVYRCLYLVSVVSDVFLVEFDQILFQFLLY